ncbi:MAG: ESX-1 secretion-associated protein [Actinomycetia bacterium]|nr:ESX-1 secretion-associated protein [Actinomycetes bacterium]MCH9701613.1 ESX-1 secretion-associated protein [Actinomycetes bacterium]MCH9761778.1 ESX-1 secretion-associated protein [Actinomycetes bacterium]
MHARLSADTDLIRAYGSASAGHAADLQSLAARLTALGTESASTSSSMFGPVGARFDAALIRAAEREARRVTELSVSLAGARLAAWSAAQAYVSTDEDAGNRITGTW